MSRDINKVRKSIEQRKKERGRMLSNQNEQPFLFDDVEEKHGYPPSISEHAFESGGGAGRFAPFIMKGILSGILFFSIALLLNSDNEALQKPQQVVSGWLQKEFPFAKVNVWYQDVFGSPLAMHPQTNAERLSDSNAVMPVSGTITESFQVNGKGVKITPSGEVDVFAHQAGVVIFAGNDDETGKTIVVQHEDGTNSSYGFLDDMEVYLYQYVTANQRIGKFTPEADKDAFYFSLEKDNDYLDPVQVIEVDDVP